ncbi:MAG: proton-conducting transporter membrane subunit [Acidiphilium sp.]|jgi:formate hydrogenlyase subunit 3/multisubunit Na+/H+ antiporter MnhD subunit|nr:proton-conducting transporter membrane subunit [Acidiphilium sp.]
MAGELIAAAALLWLVAALIALAGTGLGVGRILVALGCGCGIAAAILALPDGTKMVQLPFLSIADSATGFRLQPAALWLMGFGLAPALFVALLGSPAGRGGRTWLFGMAFSLLGSLGVFGLQNGAQFLIAWELMSLGGAAMVLGEGLAEGPGHRVLFMLGLLEVGAVGLLVALLSFGAAAHTLDFVRFGAAGLHLPGYVAIIAGVLLLIGFGAKLGLLPFYEWFPGAYGAGSGATGAIMSGVVLNAAFFGLARGMMVWMPAGFDQGFGILLCAIGVISAILTTLYAFQQEDWRSLLAFSSAENASIAVIALGAALLFEAGGKPMLAALAFTVALLHLAGHALAKGCLFLTADGIYGATGSFAIVQRGVLRANRFVFGAGALFAVMSLAAMPPQAGFVSEWFMFQTVFQGFHLPDLAGRLTLVLSGAGLALTAAIAFATFVKLFGIGMQGRAQTTEAKVDTGHTIAVALLGLGVLVLAVGMPTWLGALTHADLTDPALDAAAKMTPGWLLVPLTDKFAFISPSKLVIVMPLLSLLPIGLAFAVRRGAIRRVPVWYGGSPREAVGTATTALTFSNSLRTFYSFVYRPTAETERDTTLSAYFVRRLRFDHDVAPIFGPILFRPVTRFVVLLARRIRGLQSGHLNFYLAILGMLLVVILAISLF